LLAWNDENPGVRAHAPRLAEPRFTGSGRLSNEVLKSAGDPDIRVRFQTAFSLGESRDARATEALLRIAKRDATNAWVQTAVLSSMASRAPDALVSALADESLNSTTEGAQFERQLAFIVGAHGDETELARILEALSGAPATSAKDQVIAGLADGMKRGGKSISQLDAKLSSALRKILGPIVKHAATRALDNKQSASQRQQAIQMLAFDEFPQAKETLLSLLEAKQPQEIQMLAVRTLASFTNREISQLLVTRWSGFTPAIRGEVVEAMVARKDRLNPLLDAVEARNISTREIPATRQTMLMSHKDKTISDRAKTLFGQNLPSPRKEVIEKYQAALTLKGDKARGEKIFETTCMGCHRAGTKGNDVGPNLATVRAWSADQIMVNVLDPNREVSPQYVNYEVELKNGDSLGGVIAEETATSVTLKRANNVQDTILRENIARISSSKMSLMPEGLEAGIPPQGMADLIAFLTGP
jgi:putative heme-binding domain-containing protein